MLKAALITIVSIPLVLVGLVLSSGFVVVDVQQEDGPRIVVPIPLFVTKAALSFAPDEAVHVEVPEMAEYMPLAEQVIDELRDAPDGVLVEVRDGDELVLIEKVGDQLEIRVDSDDEQVEVNLPLSMIAEICESYDGETLEVRDVVSALSSASGELVHVRNGEAEVRIRVW